MAETVPRLERELRVEGRGLHGGERGAVRVRAAPSGTGWLVGRDGDLVPLDASLAVPDSVRCTTLRLPGGDVRTIEHLFAALAGCGIRDVAIEFEGPEVPILDGSARPWVEAIRSSRRGRDERRGGPGPGCAGPGRTAGCWAAEPPGPGEAVPCPVPAWPSFRLRHGAATYFVEPARSFSATITIEGPHPRLGVLRASCDGTTESFVRDVAPARTWALREEVEALWAAGLAKGGSLDCAVVLGPDGPLGGPLRFPDEPVRHKLLDLIGDLALLGGLPSVRVEARSPFHGGNRTLARELAAFGRPGDIPSNGWHTQAGRARPG
jgi:UDP-3-O-[3-hydroxymyristoyl] N-acetylglucosamine deacetylase